MAPTVTIGRAYGQSDTGSGSLVIKELTGDERTVTLSGRALPLKPMAWEVEHRIEETAAAGFAQTSQQPTGPQELPSQWNGAWKTRFLSDPLERFAEIGSASSEIVEGEEVVGVSSNTIRTAEELCELFYDICRKGQLLKVSWLHLTRIGRLAKFKQSWTTAHDVDWTCDFKWVGPDEDAPAATPSESNLSNITQQVLSGYVELEDATSFDELPNLNGSFADEIDTRIGALNRLVSEMEDNIQARVGGAVAPIDSLRRAFSTMTAIRDESELFILDIEETVAPAMLLVADKFDLTPIPCGHAIAAACARMRAVRAARGLRHRAARQRYAALRQLDANLLAVVLCKQEQDLRVLASIYYGTPDAWELIRAYNGFDGSIVPIGTVVLIPVREAA